MNKKNGREYWDEIADVGKLYLEEELVVGYEPVLFVCVSEDGKSKYLVMAYDSCEGVYVYRNIDAKSLLKMLHNQKTMEETFRDGTCLYVTSIDEESDLLKAEKVCASDFDANMLPKKGEYFELESEYIRKYIKKLERELTCRYIDYDFYMEQAESVQVYEPYDFSAEGSFSVQYEKWGYIWNGSTLQQAGCQCYIEMAS